MSSEKRQFYTAEQTDECGQLSFAAYFVASQGNCVFSLRDNRTSLQDAMDSVTTFALSISLLFSTKETFSQC